MSSRGAQPKSTPNLFRTTSGLPIYDAALRLLPPPRFQILHGSEGLGVLLQTGHSVETSRMQESRVPPGADHVLVVFPRGAAAQEVYFGARPTKGAPVASAAAIAAGTECRWVTRPHTDSLGRLHIGPTLLCRLLPELPPSASSHFIALDDDWRMHLAKGFCARLEAGPLGRLEAESFALLLAPLLAGQSPRRGQATGGLAAWQLSRATDILAANLAEDISLGFLAANANLSPYHFARAFKQSTGLPPHRYHIMLRIERAKVLLTNTSMAMSDVAAAVGYDDQSHFAQLFRREAGVTPSAYRRKRRG